MSSQPINVSQKALAKVLQLMQDAEDFEVKLRIYIQGGGCSGFMYGFKFDKAINVEEDIVMQHQLDEHTITVVVDNFSLPYLEGSSLDYVDSLQGQHFVVDNPHAKTTCGCGASFDAN